MGQFIEFHVNNEKNDGDVGLYDGRQWRAVKALVKECEAGMHPHIGYISRVVYGQLHGLDEIIEDEFMYEKEE
jgi:hypothetical protein